MDADVVSLEGGKVEIHTTRLQLRGAVSDDAGYLNNAFADPVVMRYW